MKKKILLILLELFIVLPLVIYSENTRKVQVFTVRKSGSHLVKKLFKLFNIDCEVHHLLYLEELEKFMQDPQGVGVVLIRDPRDVCVSGVFWRTNRWTISNLISSSRKLNGEKVIFDPHQLTKWNQASFDEKLLITIEHNFPLPYSQINLEYELAKTAISSGRCFLLKFEDLVGSKGGGDDLIQFQVIKSLLTFLKNKPIPKKIRNIQSSLFGKSATFRKGKIGSWKEHFKQIHIDLFKEKMNHTLLDWGYEKIPDWDKN